MHPSQMGPFRKTLLVIMTLGFTGALLIFTGQANLDLLKSVYPNPQFYMFGLLCLEGGILYWMGYYLLHLSGVHKAIALAALTIDAMFSGVGFFYEMESVTKSLGTVSLPPIIVIIGACVCFNVAMSIISHLIPASSKPIEQPKGDIVVAGGTYAQGYRTLAQEAVTEQGPSLKERAIDSIASLVATGQEIQERAATKRRKPVTAIQSIDTDPESEAVTDPKKS